MTEYAAPRKGEELPVTKPGQREGESVTTHPAFAQIRASRVSGRINLYDSDFEHANYITVSICVSELHRNLNRDWHFGRDDYIDVAMSEAQWATFVSSMNVGSGVPCTIQRLAKEAVSGIPPIDRKTQFGNEVRDDLSDSIKAIDAALAAIDALGLSGKKAAATKEPLLSARRTLESSIPFVAEQFDKHVEKTVEKGKQEIHGYMTNVIQRAGFATLSGNTTLPLLIEDGNDH